jgi:uncharacterized protein (TIGR03067 family)
MRPTTLALVCLSAFTVMPARAADAAKDDLAKLQGTWAVVLTEHENGAVAPEELAKLSVEITGDKRVLKRGETVLAESTFKLNPSTSPKSIDLTVNSGPLKGKVFKGIYDIDGDVHRVCITVRGDDRPADFTARPGSGRQLQVFRRPGSKQEFRAAAAKEPALRAELLAMMKEDQAARVRMPELMRKKAAGEDVDGELKDLMTKGTAIDAKNTARMKEIVEKYGWPGASLIGNDGSLAAFLLVQHADRDRAFQQKCLPLIAAAVKAKEASPQHLAYLTDRLLVAEGKKQVYGTQLRQADGKLEPAPIEDEANVDKRRAEIGLAPLADYIKQVQGGPAPKKDD